MTTEAEDSTEPRPAGLRQQAVTGVVWITLEKWSVKLSTLLGFVILGNLLTPKEFGVVALAMTFITILTTVTDGGFSLYLTQKKGMTRATTSTAFLINTVLTLTLAVAVVALAAPAAGWLDVPELRSVLPALAVGLLIAGLSVVPAALLTRELRFKELAIRQMIATLVSVAVAIGLAVAGAGVWALVGQTLARSVVAFVILWATSDFRPRWEFHRGEAREMTVFGGQSLLVTLQGQLRNQGVIFIIGALAGPVVLGYWTIASRLVYVVVDVLSSVVGAVAHPVFARLQDTPERLTRALATTRGLSTLVLAPTLVLLALVSDQVVPAVFGEQWAPITTVASIMSLVALLQSLSNFDRSVLLATGHPTAELVLTTVAVVLQLGLAFVFHSQLELLALGSLATAALMIPLRLLVIRRLLDVPLGAFSGAATTLLAAGIAAGAVIGGQARLDLEGVAYLAFAAVAGAVVYVGAALLVARPEVLELVGILRGLVSRRARARAA